MMRHLFAAAALALLAGCSVSFDQNGQPCDAKKQCLTGFHCDATNHCVSGNPASSGSSGSGSGSSGTTTGGSTTGSSTSTSSSSTGTTGSQGCATKICPAAQACALVGSTPTCVARGAGTCDSATPCTNLGEVCITPGGDGAGGICIQTCTLGSTTCPPGDTCIALTGERGDTFSACVPQPGPQACSRSTQCGSGQACVPFDVSSLGTGSSTVVNDLPVLFCDLPVAGGLGPGGTCTKGSDCASGLCIDTGGGVGSCQTPCEQSTDCTTGQTCSAVAEVGLSRHAMACVTGATGCTSCTACGADAPTCDASLSVCTLPCDTEDIDPCGHTGSCVGSGTSTYCAVNGAACP